jgi:hypothetical protein
MWTLLLEERANWVNHVEVEIEEGAIREIQKSLGHV